MPVPHIRAFLLEDFNKMSISSAGMIVVAETQVFLWLSMKELPQHTPMGSQYRLRKWSQSFSIKHFAQVRGCWWGREWFKSCLSSDSTNVRSLFKRILNNLKRLKVSWYKTRKQRFGFFCPPSQPSLVYISFLSSWNGLCIVFLQHKIKTTVLIVWFLLCD